jgi:lipoprotein LprG
MLAARICVALAISPVVSMTACGSPPPDPATLLREAKSFVDSAKSVHFQLSSKNAVGAGPVITGGSGDLLRPDNFSGTLSVTLAGFAVDIDVVSARGKLFVKLPTDSAFTPASAADYGFADPANLIDQQHGVSSLLLMCASTSSGGDDDFNGERLHEVGCTLPGHAVAALLTDADPAQGVAATFGITTDNQLRKVVLNGPFYSKTKSSTFTLVLDEYGENVAISPPPSAG